MRELAFRVMGDHPRQVELNIYDSLGTLVACPLRPAALPPGRYSAWWEGKTLAGQPAPPGIYLVRCAADDDRAFRVIEWRPDDA